jgi:hypothetical protein
MDQGLKVRGIEIPGSETVKMAIEPGLVEHAQDRLIYSTTILESDCPEKWPRLTKAAKLQACLIFAENEKSNKIDTRIAE